MTAFAGEIHPAAELFPLMSDADLAALAEDIRKHGLRDDIETLNGQLLDGRNRLRACEIAGVAPRFVEASMNGETPAEYVVSTNLHRRHLTTAQRAALAVGLLPHLEAEARERQKGGQGGVLLTPEMEEAKGESATKAAAIVGVGRSTVAHVKAIQLRAPDVVGKLLTGEIKTVSAAAKAAGFKAMGQNAHPIEGGKLDSRGRTHPAIYYGRGDRFADAVEPMRRYLRAWRKRDFEFTHVNPKEARRRLAVLDDIAHGLEQARRDLESRSETARLSL